MSIGLTQFGASLQGMAMAMARETRAASQQATGMAARDRMKADAARAVEPSQGLAESPSEIRARVMAERGVDSLVLMRLGPQARIEVEISINAETAQRARQSTILSTGTYIDLRV